MVIAEITKFFSSDRQFEIFSGTQRKSFYRIPLSIKLLYAKSYLCVHYHCCVGLHRYQKIVTDVDYWIIETNATGGFLVRSISSLPKEEAISNNDNRGQNIVDKFMKWRKIYFSIECYTGGVPNFLEQL